MYIGSSYFNEQELCYIHADIDDQNHPIHRKFWGGTGYDIVCHLPKGNYHLTFKRKSDALNAYGALCLKGIRATRGVNSVAFSLEDGQQLSFSVAAGGDCKNMVLNLRQQALFNKKGLVFENKNEDDDNFTL